MIETLEPTADRLVVRWSDGVTAEYPWTWVRDHSHDGDTIHPDTKQRQIHLRDIPTGLRGTDATIDGASVRVDWSDGSKPASLPITFLREHRTPAGSALAPTVEPVAWDSAIIAEQWPEIEHERVMTSDDGVRDWLDLVARYGFAIATGTPATPEATERLLRRVGYVRETIFGGMWDFQADLSMADTAYTNLELLPHTDGTYSHDAPGLQMLHCLAFDGTGGESTMVDGFRIADELRRTDPAAYELLSTVPVPGQYVGDGSHLMAERPVLRHDRRGELVQVSFNNADRAPFMLPADEMDALYAALRAFESVANESRLQWRRVNPPGDAMLFDNWRVLHGRLAYTGHRHLCGGYVNREDYESRRRTLARG